MARVLEEQADELERQAADARRRAAELRGRGESEAVVVTSTVSLDEAARLSGLSKFAVRRLVESGDLETRRVGRRVLILRSSLDRFCGAA